METPNGFYFSLELGYSISSFHWTYTADIPDFDYKENDLTCAPGVGYLFRNIELSFRPQFNFAASGFNVYYYNFRLGYAISKKKGNYATVDSTLPKNNLTS